MPVPSRPEYLPRELTPYRARSYRPRGVAAALGFHHTWSSIRHSIVNPKCHGISIMLRINQLAHFFLLVTPPALPGLLRSSPPSASSLLRHCLGKVPGLASLSSGSPITGSSKLVQRKAGPSSSQVTDEEDEDVLIYCPNCHEYRALKHLCYPRQISPEL